MLTGNEGSERMGTTERIEARCAWPGCGAYSYAISQQDFDEHTGPGGQSLVAQTQEGAWACERHRYAVGGGWIRDTPR